MIGKLHTADWIIIAAFFLFQAYLGFRRSTQRGQRPDATDYLLGGRQLTLPAFVASLVSTWYGGILGVGEYSYLYGVSNWLVFGVPYYLWATVFAIFLARRARRTHFISLPDHLGQAYGRSPAVAGAVVVFVMTVPAAYILMVGDVARLLLGWPVWLGVIVGAFLSVVYLFVGGFRAAIRADLLQFACMFGGFALILPFAIHQYGGWSFIVENVPATHLTWHGGNSGWFILSWYFIAMATLVEPAFYQRCYATRTEPMAQKGIFWSIAFWIVFDFMTTTTGLYARAAMTNLPSPQTSYPALAFQVLPPGVLGLFLVGLLATIVSTVDSYMFLAAISLGRDVVSRLRPTSDRGVKTLTRWAILVSAILAVVLALSSRSVIGLWRDLGSIGVPMILLPVLYSFRKKRFSITATRAVLWIVAPGIVSAFWVSWRIATGGYPLGLEPIFPGLIVSVILFGWNVRGE
ncbi:MAG TPA: sodium:solute symporter family protein [Acidobacteriota bacterium]|nr:sodium:solute symporter family protein [Acidobacteriota bacterium]